MSDLAALAWPSSRLDDAIESLARCAGLRVTATGAMTPSPFRDEPTKDEHGPEVLGRWLDQAGARLGIEVEPVDASGAEIEDLLRGAGPALLRYQYADGHRVLLLLRARARTVQLLGPDLRIEKIPL